jgi:hypothetical protein
MIGWIAFGLEKQSIVGVHCMHLESPILEEIGKAIAAIG